VNVGAVAPSEASAVLASGVAESGVLPSGVGVLPSGVGVLESGVDVGVVLVGGVVVVEVGDVPPSSPAGSSEHPAKLAATPKITTPAKIPRSTMCLSS